MQRLSLILILICIGGCQTPKQAIHRLRNCEPCFASIETSNDASPTTFESGSIEEYVQLGLMRNPAIVAARHRVEAIRHRIPQSLSLPDPMVKTGTHLAPVQTAAGEQAFSLGVSQKFTNAERRATMAAIVADEVAAAESELTKKQLEIAAGIRQSGFQLLFIRKSIEITEEDRQSLEQISDVVTRQYEVKKSVTQQDVLNVQVEQSKVDNQLAKLRQQERSYQARLARLLHVDPTSELQITDQLATADAALDLDLFIAQASESRPELQAQLANIQRDRKKTYLARLQEIPDFTVGLNWIATSTNGISPVANGDDALVLGIGFNLPINKSRIRAGICEANSNRLASESGLVDLQDQIAEEVFDLVAKLESTNEMLGLIQQDIIPKADRSLELSIEEYATDSIEFVQLIGNWRNALRYRITEASLQSQYQQLLAALAQSIGQLNPISSEAVSNATAQPDFESPSDPTADLQNQPLPEN